MYLLNLFFKFRFIGVQPRKDDRKKLRIGFGKPQVYCGRPHIYLKKVLYVGIITIRFLVILSFFSSKSEKKKLVIFSKIYSGFSAKLVFPPLDVGNLIFVLVVRRF